MPKRDLQKNFIDKNDRLTADFLDNSKVDVIKDHPEIRFKKWNNEVDVGVTYEKIFCISLIIYNYINFLYT